jgi:hypothetical protein
MNFVTASSTSSEDFLTRSHQGPHHIKSTNQHNGGQHLVFFQKVRITPSTPSNDILSGENMDSMAEAPFREQLLGHESLTPSSHPKRAIQTKDRNQVVHAAVDSRQRVDTDLPIPNRPPTAEDWHAYRNIFTQLYKVEKKTLREVMGIMKDQYHFLAR